MPSPEEILDRHYAEQLGCTPEEFNSGGVTVVGNDGVASVLFAKGVPLALFSIGRPSGTVIAARLPLEPVVAAAVGSCGSRSLDEKLCDAVQAAVDPLVNAREWFRGRRLYCSPDGFVDSHFGETREVSREDAEAGTLAARWGGPVFGQVVDGRVVSWAAVKPLSDVAWDLSIRTLAEYRGRGYAKSAVSAAVAHIFEHGKLATWGTDTTNVASLATAHALGFVDYALDFGCIEETNR